MKVINQLKRFIQLVVVPAYVSHDRPGIPRMENPPPPPKRNTADLPDEIIFIRTMDGKEPKFDSSSD